MYGSVPTPVTYSMHNDAISVKQQRCRFWTSLGIERWLISLLPGLTRNLQAHVNSEANTTNATDNQVTVRSVRTSAPPYASKPPFDALDTNHDGVISESEAAAYPPLANDYLHDAEKGSRGVTRVEYERW